jgi:hypothetical protein
MTHSPCALMLPAIFSLFTTHANAAETSQPATEDSAQLEQTLAQQQAQLDAQQKQIDELLQAKATSQDSPRCRFARWYKPTRHITRKMPRDH